MLDKSEKSKYQGVFTKLNDVMILAEVSQEDGKYTPKQGKAFYGDWINSVSTYNTSSAQFNSIT